MLHQCRSTVIIIISFFTLDSLPKITPCIIKSISQKVNSAHHVLRKLCCKVWIWWARWTHFILRVTLQLTFKSLYPLQERIPSRALIRTAPASTFVPARTTCQPREGARVMTTPSSGQSSAQHHGKLRGTWQTFNLEGVRASYPGCGGSWHLKTCISPIYP